MLLTNVTFCYKLVVMCKYAIYHFISKEAINHVIKTGYRTV